MLVAFDDLLVARLRCCTLCGRPKAAQHAVVAITQGRTGQTLHIAYGLGSVIKVVIESMFRYTPLSEMQ
jgi:transketolase N-terminal domain/subunit